MHRESLRPFVVGEEDLRDVSRHCHEVGIERGNCRGITVDPGGTRGLVLRFRNIE